MEFVTVLLILWVIPTTILCLIAEKNGQNVTKVLIACIVGSFLGGVLALILLPTDEKHNEARAHEIRRRNSILHSQQARAMGRSQKEKEDLYRNLIGGKRR